MNIPVLDKLERQTTEYSSPYFLSFVPYFPSGELIDLVNHTLS